LIAIDNVVATEKLQTYMSCW